MLRQPGDLQGRLDGCDPPRHPWETAGQAHGFDDDSVGALQRRERTFSQANDLAAKNPEKVRSCRPRSSSRRRSTTCCRSMIACRSASTRPAAEPAGRTEELHLRSRRQRHQRAPCSTRTACPSASRPRWRSDAGGRRSAGRDRRDHPGWSLYVKDGRPTFYYNFFGVAAYRVQSSVPLPTGKSTVRVEMAPEDPATESPRR